MVYSGHVHNGVVVLDDPASLPEGAEVSVLLKPSGAEVPLVDEHGQTLGQKLMKFAGKAIELPEDAARNHDHYLTCTELPNDDRP